MTTRLIRPPARTIRTWHMDNRRWDGYRPRAGDIVIGTYPKCGTTWTQQIVSLLIFQSTEPRPVTAMSPWVDMRFITPIKDTLALIEAQTHRRFLKTHLPFDALPYYEGVSYIHVARDGLDAFMSWHNHSRRYQRFELLDEAGLKDQTIARPYPRPAEDPRDFFRAWIGADPAHEQDISATSYFDTERSYWAARGEPNMLLVHYNDLLADLDREMRRIADFLEIKTPPALWPDLVRAATFEAMRRDGKALMPHATAAWAGGHEGFIYEGRNDRWREALSETDIALYRARAEKELDPDLNAWLTHKA